ncbi:MAG: polysaccharide biosynthesis tyrosine autokinase [Dorea sp.]|nr:polysaccharide biosynthesis tyrosine autokinase [Dorea sp.]
MEEYRESIGSSSQTEPERIDITDFLLDMQGGLKKLWWLIIVCVILFAAKSYFLTTLRYVSNYEAYAVTSVASATGASAGDMAEVFPYILTSGVLEDVIADDLGLDAVPGTITATAEDVTNLLTIKVTADDPQMAYTILLSVIDQYPQVAKFVVGETTLKILDESGIPSDTKRESIVRGSYKRGAMQGLIVSLLIIAIYSFLRRTVKSGREIRSQMNLTDLGNLPFIREKKRRKGDKNKISVLNDRIPRGYVESLRKIRIKITKAMEDHSYKTLLVTSSAPGEGKTTVSMNIALSMAEQGNKVILVDCDLRNPSVAKALNLDTTDYLGLGEMLSGNEKKVSVKDLLISVPVADGRLRVICGGKGDADPRLLGTKRMQKLLEALSTNADYIILDTAPSGLLADALVLAKYVDAAVYVVRNDYTRMRQIKEGIEALGLTGIQILGFVFNGDNREKNRGYGYGYGYGYSRYAGSYGKIAKNGTDSDGRIVKN